MINKSKVIKFEADTLAPPSKAKQSISQKTEPKVAVPSAIRFVPIEGIPPFEMTPEEEAEALDFMRQAKAYWA